MKRWLQSRLTRRVRRILVILYFLLFFNGIAVLFLGLGNSGREADAAAMLGLIGALFLGALFSGVTLPTDFRLPGSLDERQSLVRLRAMADSYRLVCILLVLGFGLVALKPIYGFDLRAARLSESAGLYHFLPFVLLLPGLPQAFVAWREPDLEPDQPGKATR
jgi:hypothetical protein